MNPYVEKYIGAIAAWLLELEIDRRLNPMHLLPMVSVCPFDDPIAFEGLDCRICERIFPGFSYTHYVLRWSGGTSYWQPQHVCPCDYYGVDCLVGMVERLVWEYFRLRTGRGVMALWRNIQNNIAGLEVKP